MNNFEIKSHENIILSDKQISTIGDNDLSRHLQCFLDELDIKENSKGTYTRAINQFFSFMFSNIEQLTSNDILTYKRHLETLGLAAYTITAYLVVVRRFFAWTESKKIY